MEVLRARRRIRKRSRGGVAVAEQEPAEPLIVSVETIEHGPFTASFVEIRRRKAQAYDAGPYQREVDYGRDAIVPPLRADQSKWAASLRTTAR